MMKLTASSNRYGHAMICKPLKSRYAGLPKTVLIR